jgi:hypothetical protein
MLDATSAPVDIILSVYVLVVVHVASPSQRMVSGTHIPSIVNLDWVKDLSFAKFLLYNR